MRQDGELQSPRGRPCGPQVSRSCVGVVETLPHLRVRCLAATLWLARAPGRHRPSVHLCRYPCRCHRRACRRHRRRLGCRRRRRRRHQDRRRQGSRHRPADPPGQDPGWSEEGVARCSVHLQRCCRFDPRMTWRRVRGRSESRRNECGPCGVSLQLWVCHPRST